MLPLFVRSSNRLREQWREMLNQAFVFEQALLPQRVRCSLQVDRIPKHDSSGDQVEAARTVALLFETAVADLAKTMEENRSGQGVPSLSLVEPRIDSSS